MIWETRFMKALKEAFPNPGRMEGFPPYEGYDAGGALFAACGIVEESAFPTWSQLAQVVEALNPGASPEMVDRELGLVILQRFDLHAKVAAIREYNRMRRRAPERPQPELFLLEEKHKKRLDAILK